MKLGKHFLALLLMAIIATAAYAQNGFTKRLKPQGWNVPSVENLERLREDKIAVDGYRIQQITYKLPKPPPFVFTPKKTRCEFQWLSIYVAAGEVFAVGGDCVQFAIDPRHRKFYFGGLGNFSFFDEDGDGKFETFISSGFQILFLPARLRRPEDLIPREPVPPPPAKRPI